MISITDKTIPKNENIAPNPAPGPMYAYAGDSRTRMIRNKR